MFLEGGFKEQEKKTIFKDLFRRQARLDQSDLTLLILSWRHCNKGSKNLFINLLLDAILPTILTFPPAFSQFHQVNCLLPILV